MADGAYIVNCGPAGGVTLADTTTIATAVSDFVSDNSMVQQQLDITYLQDRDTNDTPDPNALGDPEDPVIGDAHIDPLGD